MKDTAYIFFENLEINWNRFPHYLYSCFDNQDFFFVYNVSSSTSKKSQIPNTLKYDGNIDHILDRLKDHSKIKVILMSFRPIDLIFFKHLKDKSEGNVTGIKIQHGIYSDKLERATVLNFIKSTKNRLISYAKTIYNTNSLNTKEKLIFILETFNIYFRNRKKFSESKQLIKLLPLPENVFVYNHFWEEYFNLNFYSNNPPKYYHIPPKDLDLIKRGIIKTNSVVIIAQSLVEDGRYSKELLRKELNQVLKNIPENLTIYLKRHPRSDNKLYQNLSKKVFVTDEFIISDFVISGYSSLMQVYQEIGCNVFSWKFKDHHNPTIFNNYACAYGRENELVSFFGRKVKEFDSGRFKELDIQNIYSKKLKNI